jgi:alpha-L-fucosidase
MSRVFAAAALGVILVAAPVARSAEVDMAKRAEELKNLKFGMFICWSFSTFSDKEQTSGIKDVAFFHPSGCDADQWASVAKEAGMGYILFLTKHADGFCLWDTKTTDRKVTKSPLGKDVLAEVKRACDKHGLKLALYYGEGDWTWPGAVDGGTSWPGHIDEDAVKGHNPEAKKAQLKELLTQYGPVEFFWFDYAAGDGGLDHQATTAFIKGLQPGCFVGFNHGQLAGDLRLGEMGSATPLDDPRGAGVGAKQPGIREYKGFLAAEFTMPILAGRKSGRWFYTNPADENKAMSAEQVFTLYQGAVKFGNIFSLDVAPDRAGRLREIDVRTLRKVGELIRASSTGGSPNTGTGK